jgi:hypothetical protein
MLDLCIEDDIIDPSTQKVDTFKITNGDTK